MHQGKFEVQIGTEFSPVSSDFHPTPPVPPSPRNTICRLLPQSRPPLYLAAFPELRLHSTSPHLRTLSPSPLNFLYFHSSTRPVTGIASSMAASGKRVTSAGSQCRTSGSRTTDSPFSCLDYTLSCCVSDIIWGVERGI